MNTRKLYQAEDGGMILDMPNTGLRYHMNNEMVRKTDEPIDENPELPFDTTAQAVISNAIDYLPTGIENGAILDTPGAVSDYDKLLLIKEIIEEKMEDFD